MYVHVRRKNHVVCKLHYSLLPMLETKNLQSFEKNGNDPFSKQYLQTQASKIFQSLKDLNENTYISFFQIFYSLNLDENTFRLSLKNKLMSSFFLIELL
jgi:hypothetical protein